MVKSSSIAEAQALAAAERIEAARDAGQQLALPLADETAAGAAKRGRGAGKATSQMRDWLATKGFRMPEDVLAEMAALTTGQDAFMAAMLRAEQILAWAQGAGGAATPKMRLEAFEFVFTAQFRALDALLPYGLGKVTPDVAPAAAVTIVMPGAQGAPERRPGPDQARDVTPKDRRMQPPPMPGEIEGNQGVAIAVVVASDAARRTEGASD